MEFQILLTLHLLGAIFIIGGSLIATFIIIPLAKKSGSNEFALMYLNTYRKINHPVLLIQLLTGFRLGMIYVPINEWFSFSSSVATTVVLKLSVVILIIAWMIIARATKMVDPSNPDMDKIALFSRVLTVFALTLMFLGLNVRLGFF